MKFIVHRDTPQELHVIVSENGVHMEEKVYLLPERVQLDTDLSNEAE